jgi:hypothetical protein
MTSELDEVAANQRLALGKMRLQDAQCRRLIEYAFPGRSVIARKLTASATARHWPIH